MFLHTFWRFEYAFEEETSMENTSWCIFYIQAWHASALFMHKIASIFIDENKAYLEKNNFMTYIPFHKNDAINFRTLEGNPSLCHRQHKKARCIFFPSSKTKRKYGYKNAKKKKGIIGIQKILQTNRLIENSVYQLKQYFFLKKKRLKILYSIF